MAPSFLLDGNGRRQAFDDVDVRLFHETKELAGIGRQRFHVSPLPLGVDRIERQRGFAGTRQARHHCQAIAGYLYGDVP